MLTDRRILLVENEALIAMMVEDELRAAGAEVEVAASIGEARRMVENRSFDLAVLELGIEGIEAVPVADRLAERGVPFIFATGYRGTPGRHRARPLFTKPYDMPAMVATMASLVRQQQSVS